MKNNNPKIDKEDKKKSSIAGSNLATDVPDADYEKSADLVKKLKKHIKK